mgnify:CR=1 FL=1
MGNSTARAGVSAGLAAAVNRGFSAGRAAARHVRVLPIAAETAFLSQSDVLSHGDPADRLIAATARLHRAPLITSDAKLRKLKEVTTIE